MNTTEKEVGALAAEKLSPLGSKYFVFSLNINLDIYGWDKY